MRFIHIADIHLGAEPDAGSAYSKSRPREIWNSLERICGICEEEGTDLLLIAGDLFHRQPLLRELKEVNACLGRMRKTQVALIIGNHDYLKPGSYYRSFSWAANIHPLLSEELECLELPKLSTAVYGMSYHSREITGRPYEGMGAPGRQKHEILMLHGGDEKHMPIDGKELSSLGYDYVALGHIHGPQNVGVRSGAGDRAADGPDLLEGSGAGGVSGNPRTCRVRYCGTPLKYSFSEAGHQKSVTVAELGKKGELSVRTLPLTPLRDLREIRGTYLELTAKSFYEEMNRSDYLHVTLTDEEDVPDALGKLRVIYPNLMKLDYDNQRTRAGALPLEAEDAEQKSPLALFSEFYEKQNNQPMSGEQQAFVEELIERIWRNEG